VPEHEIEQSSTTAGLPVAPSLGPSLRDVSLPTDRRPVDARVGGIAVRAVIVAIAAAFVAQLLTRLIALITNLAFFGRWSVVPRSPAENHLGLLVVAIPILGALVVGVMARFGSAAIRGHGIPEAMEQILQNESRIPARMTFLKPLSAAISIGTGGPFGAEGPIIATGGALGSLFGQLSHTSAAERKTLLAAGAAAGMAATFGTPLSAVLLAVELLLFEFRAASLIPVALATTAAAAVRLALVGGAPAFAMPELALQAVQGRALFGYALLGGLVGLGSIGVTRAVYAIEDAFERLPIHWMWWPALGAVAVGVVGVIAPRTLGVGYDNIEAILCEAITGRALVFLCAMKFVSWSISLGSGTSGGTLAPLLTIGGGIGAGIAELFERVGAHLDPRVGALVGMAAMFAGASRALLASVVFAFEATHQPVALLPILAGGAAGYLASSLFMRSSIMTEKIERRGVRVVGDYRADLLDRHNAGEVASAAVVIVDAAAKVADVRARLAEGKGHQGFPVVAGERRVIGVVMRRELDAAAAGAIIGELVKRPPVVVFPDSTLRDAVEQMAREHVGRLPVVEREAPHRLVGILTRKDVVGIFSRGVREGHRERGVSMRDMFRRRRA
jgi:chloride channel protein, CIC family